MTKSKHLHRHSPVRIFGVSVAFTIILSVLGVMYGGLSALPIILTLLVIEITFSFENAIINARILTKLSTFWQNIFLTVGIFIAIFGMRVIFPIAIVSIAANTGWREVIELALNDPEAYSALLEQAYPSIAAFGGAFLLMLAASYFFNKSKTYHWIYKPEKYMQEVSTPFTPLLITAGAVGMVGLLPNNQHSSQTFTAGAVGMVTFLVIHGLSEYFSKIQNAKEAKEQKSTNNKALVRTGWAAFMTFLYLELLDASFSLDGVIGAFAITNQVVLIAIGLGIGAFWVRSMTIFIVRKGTLNDYAYLEHGAHYTVFVLACTMFLSEIFNIPEFISGAVGIIIITLSIRASKKAQEN